MCQAILEITTGKVAVREGEVRGMKSNKVVRVLVEPKCCLQVSHALGTHGVLRKECLSENNHGRGLSSRVLLLATSLKLLLRALDGASFVAPPKHDLRDVVAGLGLFLDVISRSGLSFSLLGILECLAIVLRGEAGPHQAQESGCLLGLIARGLHHCKGLLASGDGIGALLLAEHELRHDLQHFQLTILVPVLLHEGPGFLQGIHGAANAFAAHGGVDL
mmetsp:Transcript_65850/g.157319  ORF Transcript_65850/g.157319 Transcript_65850/m.157319 type:complete len:219 (-) Transcript_65850:101-757(-)